MSRRNPDTIGSIKDILILGGIGYGIYLILQISNKAPKAVATAYNTAVNWTSDLFTSWFGPDEVGTNTYHLVTFQDDGSRHAVGANVVNTNGQFTWTGYPPGSQDATTYQLGKDSDGNWVASPVVTVMGAYF